MKRFLKWLFGCRCCYHYFPLSKSGGDPKGRRVRGFYGTFKRIWCGKHDGYKSDYSVCDDFDFTLLAGADCKGYDSNKPKGVPWWKIDAK